MNSIVVLSLDRTICPDPIVEVHGVFAGEQEDIDRSSKVLFAEMIKERNKDVGEDDMLEFLECGFYTEVKDECIRYELHLIEHSSCQVFKGSQNASVN